MEQLFLIEILVETIMFSKSVPVPQKKQIYITARFGNFANLEIRYDGIAMGEESSKSSDIEYSTGKSYLFPCNADVLLEALKKDPLELTVGTKTNPLIGKASFAWTEDFIAMLDSCGESVGYVTPTNLRDVFPLIDNNGVTTGNIDAFIRLSCFGKSIQTQFQIIPLKDAKDGAPKSQYLFKSTNAATTFQCERYGLGASADIIPVGPVYNPIEFEDLRCLRSVYQAPSRSVCGSVMPSVFELDDMNGNTAANAISYPYDNTMRERPPSAKFTKLDEVRDPSFKKTYTNEDLTPENINKLLCKHCDCPAAKKFKEYGLGPLATGKGLGTIYGTVEPPTTYGLSHAHGKMERYGPYGVYSRPKRVDQEFVPKRDDDKSEGPLRLSGGAPMEESGTPSPLLACKELMADFDKILAAYKKALGPCGHASCPFAENLIMESCKLVCPGRDESHEFPLTPAEIVAQRKPPQDEDTISTCGIPSCPYSRKMTQPVEEEVKLGQIKSACGDPTCPYVKQRCRLYDEEADEATIQLANLPKNCGAAKCPYTPQPTLPPIHWDCPDPLPKGPCKNPNCPISKREQLAACMFQPPISPCQKPLCPYKIPPPCNFPGCPFGPPLPCNIPGCPYSLPPFCTDPNCPLNNLQKKQSSTDTLCNDDTCKNLRGDDEEDEEVEQGPIAIKERCTPHTCSVKGGTLKCTRCGGKGRKDCPCERKSKKGKIDEDEGGPAEGAVEVCSGDTMEPCTPHTCTVKGGDLECAVCKGTGDTRKNEIGCPCGGKPKKAKTDEDEGGPAEGAVEVCSGDTMEPCTPHTCTVKGGDLECAVCKGTGDTRKNEIGCPCGGKPKKAKTDEDEGGPAEGAVEVCSGDTMEPCTPHTCRAKGGDLRCTVCKRERVCPCSTKGKKDESDEGGGGEGAVEVCSGDTLEPCTPHTCTSKQGGTLKCTVCGGEGEVAENEGVLPDQPIMGSGVPCPCTSPKLCTEAGAKQRKPIEKKQKLSKAVVLGLIKGTAPPKRTQWSAEPKTPKTTKKVRKTKFVYDTGDTYPGIKIGHRECVTPRCNVPYNMGWLWNIKPPGRLKPRRGWKPGALTKTMAATIIKHRLKSGIKPLIGPPTPQKPKKKPKKMNAYGVYETDSEGETIVPKPTLQIKKKDGCYMITMNPLKDPFSLEDNENPYMDCTPMQFKISKKPPPPGPPKEEEGEESSCCCGDDKSSSESELDIEFTPPAGILHPEKLKKKKNLINIDTQYCPGDFTQKDDTLQLKKKSKKGKKDKKGGKKGKKGGKKGKKK